MLFLKFLFFAFGSVFGLINESGVDKLQQLESKLRVTQNKTNMSEEEYQILWNKAMKSYEAVGRSKRRRNKRSNRNSDTRMLQYQRTSPWSVTEKPINFNKKINNFGMEQNYKNGVVTITNPGIYLIQSSLRNYGSQYMHQQIIKDHQIKITESIVDPWKTSEISHIMYLDFLDTINIKLANGGPHNLIDSQSGFFTVIKLD